MTLRLLVALCSILSPLRSPADAHDPGDCVILLHGLARSARSMVPLANRLAAEGYVVVNHGYPSRQHPIDVLATRFLPPALDQCRAAGSRRLHFVTHSLGGIVVRQYLSTHLAPGLGRVVMLAPPNQGSEVVDAWRKVPGFARLNGPAGLQLGTDNHSVPRRLGAVDYPVGVIAGTRTVNLLLSLSLPNPDDGKVSVASTRVAGMADHFVVARSHPFIMNAREVHQQTLHFLAHGKFQRDESGR